MVRAIRNTGIRRVLVGFIPLLVMMTSFASEARPHRVLAFYYNWYGTPELEQGRWVHWNECHGCTHNPAKTVDVVSPRNGTRLRVPDTGTADHPFALYDSNDPAVIRKQLKIAEGAGIDAFIATWWGRGQFHDHALHTALDVASAAHSPVKFSIYYETISQQVGDPVQAVIDDFRYLLEQYGKHPAFFREGGKPVFFIYGRALQQLKPEQWTVAIAGIRALGPSIIIADCFGPRCLDLADGVHEYNPAGDVAKNTNMTAHYRQVVELCRAKGKISSATVIPGYDDSHIGREKPLIVNRENGGLYRRLWNAAVNAHPDWILITSFNEWHEGSEIEPSQEWGDWFVTLTHNLARKFKQRESHGGN